MYNEKYLQHKKCSRKRSERRKATVLLTSFLLLIVFSVATTVAFLVDSDGPITNIFSPSEVSIEVKEDSFDRKIKKNVTIANTGDTEVYVRAAIVITWKDGLNGNVYGTVPVTDSECNHDESCTCDYLITLDEDDWFLGSDGYYYYKKPVPAGGSTNALIETCTAVVDNTPAGYGLNVEILGSAIQSVPISVVNEKWPAVEVDTDHGELARVESGGGEE